MQACFGYKPVIWEADEGIWHALLGELPDREIWVMGTSPLEAMVEFDKELKERISADGKYINDIKEERRQELHKEVFRKIHKLMGWSTGQLN